MLSDVHESADSDLPFDIEDTILTVDSHDTDTLQMHEGLASRDVHVVRDKLNNLESMYGEIMNVLGIHGDQNNEGGNMRRRWSLGSSDTNSLRRPVKKMHGGAPGLNMLASNSQHKNQLGNRDIKLVLPIDLQILI